MAVKNKILIKIYDTVSTNGSRIQPLLGTVHPFLFPFIHTLFSINIGIDIKD